MKWFTPPLLLIFVVSFSFLFTTSYAQKATNYANDRIIVKFKPDYTPTYVLRKGFVSFGISSVDQLNRQYECTSAKRINAGRKSKVHTYTYVLHFDGSVNIPELIKKYKATDCFEYVEADYKGRVSGTTGITPNDANFSQQWSLYNDGTFSYDSAKAGADIKMKEAWGIETGDSSIVVAIIDGGAKLDHPELVGRIWENYNEVPANGTDDDNNGYVDDWRGWNFAYDNNNPADVYGHGTNVAGIIGANANNNIGYAGVDWHCKLMILKALDSNGYGYYSWWADAINYAVDNGARVINMSLEGLDAGFNALEDAADYAYSNNVTIVACMGNYDTAAPSYPAACGHVIAVGATNDHDDRVNPFFFGGGSDFGPDICVVAPGDFIYGLSIVSNTSNSTFWSGTSQATPHVTGLVSLLLAQDPTRTPDQLRHIIEVTADDTVGNPAEDVPGWDMYYGYGRINAYRALSYDNPNAVPSIASNGGIRVYPNPTTGKIFIQEANSNEPVGFSVMNMGGSVVANGTCQPGKSVIDISRQPIGTYILKLSNSHLSYNCKEVLQK